MASSIISSSLASSSAATSATAVLAVLLRGGGEVTLNHYETKAVGTSVNSLLPLLHERFWALPEALRFAVSGFFGTIIFYLLEKSIYQVLLRNLQTLPQLIAEYKDGCSYAGAYVLQIVTQHWLNAALVYGMHTISSRSKYFKTLATCYTT